MLRLPFIKKTDPIQESEGFLAICIDPYRVDLIYFKAPEGLPPDLGEVNPSDQKEIDVIYTSSRYISPNDLFESSSKIESTSQTLNAMLEEMADKYSDLPKKVIFGVPSNHCIDLMSVVRYNHPEKSKFTEEELEDLRDQAEKNATFRAQDLLASQKGDMDTDLVRITAAEISLLIDGEKVKDPVGLEGEKLELSWFGSFMEDSYLDYLQKIAKKADLEILAVSSLGYSLYSALQEASPSFDDRVIVNFGLSLTEVFVAFGGGLIGSRYINLGVSSVLAEICKKMDLHLDEAVEILEKYRSGSLDPAIGEDVQKILKKFYVVWEKALNAVFSDFSGVKTFSSKVSLVGEGFDIKDFSDKIVQETWHKSIPFKSPPRFEKSFTLDIVPGIDDLGGQAASLKWSMPLSLGTIYFKLDEQ